jgi:serine/threonine protein kinase
VADTPFGRQPFFAMECVDGTTIVDFATRRRLDVRARLALLQQVCHAVQHAHEQGIIHRDLKPSNILVTDDGQPKVLDFGIACLTDSDAPVTRHTGVGELLGTLEYMSPEQ